MLPHKTLTLDLETLFKVTAHTLTNCTLLLRYKPYYTQGREYTCMIRTKFFFKIFYDLNLRPKNFVQDNCTPFFPKASCDIERTDGRTDALITIGRPLSGVLKKIRALIFLKRDMMVL